MTQIEKEAFFAQYWGQEVAIQGDGGGTGFKYQINEATICDIRHDYLQLKPLESITDEDALEGSDLLRNTSHLSEESRIIQFKRLFESPNFWVNQTNIPLSKFFIVIDFLRSKGYLLPFKQYSTEQLIESGIAKI